MLWRSRGAAKVKGYRSISGCRNGKREGALHPEDAKEHVAFWNEVSDGILDLNNGPHLGSRLSEALSSLSEIRMTANLLLPAENAGTKILPLGVLAKRVFPDVEPEISIKAITALISAAVLAVPSGVDGYPLLPARYHISASATEGILVGLDQTNEEGWTTPEIGRNGRDATEKMPALWPLVVCRSCGQPYIEGFDDGTQIAPTANVLFEPPPPTAFSC